MKGGGRGRWMVGGGGGGCWLGRCWGVDRWWGGGVVLCSLDN